MRRRAWILLLVCLGSVAGCGREPEPVKGRLAPGSRAVVFVEPEYRQPDHSIRVAVARGSGAFGSSHLSVPPDSVVEVLEDARDPEDAKRPVRVRVTEGEWKDRTGTIERWSLRPLPTK
jgi:hypothetical protein